MPDSSGVTPWAVVPDDPEAGRALLTFLAVGGDLDRVAVALDLPIERVRSLAEAGGWARRLEALQRLRDERGPDAMAAELNRTVNYVQSVQMRQLLDRTIAQLSLLEPERLVALLSVPGKEGRVFSPRALVDLAKAVQTVHQATYAALGDTASDRDRGGAGEATKGSLGVLRMLAARGDAVTVSDAPAVAPGPPAAVLDVAEPGPGPAPWDDNEW